MKKLILISLLLFFTQPELFPQDGFRIKLIKNLNPHNNFGEINYSALWGYTAPNGREYAILGCIIGTSFIDITDTNNVREVDFLGLTVSGSTWREMKTYSHYCYIVSEAPGSNVQIVDLQYLPDSIRYVGSTSFPGHTSTHSISQSDHYLFLNGCNPAFTQGVAVVDVINPEVPVLKGKWNDTYVHDTRIINDTAWVCNIFDGKVTILDAVNKDSLKFIRSWINNPVPNAPHNMAFTSDHNFAYVTNETADPSGKIKIWDVSDLEEITYTGTIDDYPFENSCSHNIEVHDQFAFVAYYSAGVKVFNISNPNDPVEYGWFDTYPENNSSNYDGCWGVYYFPTGKIIASDRKRGLFVLKPELTNQIAAQPRINFTSESQQPVRLSSNRLIDMTEGIPTSWSWTVTGPESRTSILQNPDFTFSVPGFYTVKLKASNSFGTDSLTKSNFFRVVPAPLLNFQVINPIGPQPVRILVSATDTERVFFNWSRSTIHPDITYKLQFKKVFGIAQMEFASGNNGTDTFFYARKSFLDSMASALGYTVDSLRVFFRALVYNGQDSLASSNSISLILKKTGTGIQTVNDLIPSVFRLHHNYPNPFNPVTKINFDLPFSGQVLLKIYDITGKEIMTIINEVKPAGYYSAEFDGSNLSSGVYIYRFESGDFVDAKKFVLLK